METEIKIRCYTIMTLDKASLNDLSHK